MKRVLILGLPGSGKTTLSNMLSDTLGLHAYHADSVYFVSPGIKRSKDDAISQFRQITQQDAWILEGAYLYEYWEILLRSDHLIIVETNKFARAWHLITRNFRKHGLCTLLNPFSSKSKSLSIKVYRVLRYGNSPEQFEIARKYRNMSNRIPDNTSYTYIGSTSAADDFLLKLQNEQT